MAEPDPDAIAQRRMVADLFRVQPHPALRDATTALPPYADDAAALARARRRRLRSFALAADDATGDLLPQWWRLAQTAPEHWPRPTPSLWPCRPVPCNAAANPAANPAANAGNARTPFLRGGLLAASAGATTTDHRDQAAANVLTDAPDRFWSSTGEEAARRPPPPPPPCRRRPRAAASSSSSFSEERLTFVLASASGGGAVVSGVSVRAYRASFQPGHPVYPPLELQVWLGASLASLAPAGPWLPFWPSAELQAFPVAAASVAGGGRAGGCGGHGGARVLQVRLRGRPQWQLEDLRFYLALRYCGASGALLPPATPLPSPAAAEAAAAAAGAGAGGGTFIPPLLRWHARGRGSGTEAAMAAAAGKEDGWDIGAEEAARWWRRLREERRRWGRWGRWGPPRRQERHHSGGLLFRAGELVDRTEGGRGRQASGLGGEDAAAAAADDDGEDDPDRLAAALRARAVCLCRPRAPPAYAEAPPPAACLQRLLADRLLPGDRLRQGDRKGGGGAPSEMAAGGEALWSRASHAAHARHAVAGGAFVQERGFWLPSAGGGGGGCSCMDRAYGFGALRAAREGAALAALAAVGEAGEGDEEEEEEEEEEGQDWMEEEDRMDEGDKRAPSAAEAAPLHGAALVDPSLAPYWPVGPGPPRRSQAAARVPLASLFEIYGGGEAEEDEEDEEGDDDAARARADAVAAAAWASAALSA